MAHPVRTCSVRGAQYVNLEFGDLHLGSLSGVRGNRYSASKCRRIRRALVARSRAPTVFLVRIETIRTKNTVPDKGNDGSGLLLYEIVDCARMCFSSVRNRRSARTAFRPRNSATLQQLRCDLSRDLNLKQVAHNKAAPHSTTSFACLTIFANCVVSLAI